MLEIAKLNARSMSVEPYRWAAVDGLFERSNAKALAATFPTDHFKTVTGYDGEKGYRYEARSLIHMGASAPTHAGFLSAAWQELARDLLSPGYRSAMSALTGLDLHSLQAEVNVFHYGPGSWLGPHVDLKAKLVTHVLYFNDRWDESNGGCLAILRSADSQDVASLIVPVIGNSSVVVRSDNSWHTVTPVSEFSRRSRRSMTVTFYSPGSLSTLWPPGEVPELRDYSNDRATLTNWFRSR